MVNWQSVNGLVFTTTLLLLVVGLLGFGRFQEGMINLIPDFLSPSEPAAPVTPGPATPVRPLINPVLSLPERPVPVFACLDCFR